MRKPIATMLLAAVSSSAMAEWVQVSGTESNTVYADPATIHMAGNTVKMWSLYDFKAAQAIGELQSYLSSKQQYEYDCKEKRLRTFSYSFHAGNMATGEVTLSATKTGDWERIAPASVDNDLWKIACGQR
jgi:Surface-adhesin protein E